MVIDVTFFSDFLHYPFAVFLLWYCSREFSSAKFIQHFCACFTFFTLYLVRGRRPLIGREHRRVYFEKFFVLALFFPDEHMSGRILCLALFPHLFCKIR